MRNEMKHCMIEQMNAVWLKGLRSKPKMPYGGILTVYLQESASAKHCTVFLVSFNTKNCPERVGAVYLFNAAELAMLLKAKPDNPEVRLAWVQP